MYFGLDEGFNARARATNFQLDGLPSLMHDLHRRGVRGYVTLNTLAFSEELPRIEGILRELAAAGVDAVLVQDIGVARLARRICPDLALHASTQMTMTCAESIEVISGLGIERVVLARELSIAEIRAIHEKTDIPLEAFVHGALCVAYSGQCLTSEALGGRSANRGQCAQACRLPYDLICDGEQRDLGDQKYLLSPQDLAAFELIPQLMEAGVTSFKIEGRLKTAEYVANITQHYREAIDGALSGRPVRFTRRQIQQMEQSFSRGFSPGWLNGCDHKMLVPALSSSRRGVLLGEVTAVFRDRVQVRLDYLVAAGDGVVFEGDRFRQEEQGGRVYEVWCDGVRQSEPQSTGIVELTFDRRAVDLTRLQPGLKIWKTDDPQLNETLRRSYRTADPVRRVGLSLHVHAEAGQALRVTGRTTAGATCHVVTADQLPQALKHPLTAATLREQLGRLGGTVYQLRDVEATIIGQPMVPHSVLGSVRRMMIEQLDRSLRAPVRRIEPEPVLPQLRGELPDRCTPDMTATLSVMCRSLDQLRAVIAWSSHRLSPWQGGAGLSTPDTAPGPAIELIADFQDLREFREAVLLAREAGHWLWLATPRIQKPDEAGICAMMLKRSPDGVLVRHLSGLKFFSERGVPVVTDFSLNVTNELSAQFLMQLGATRLTAAYDLNRDQLVELVRAGPPQWLEVVIHQHMPLFHMEHCVFCAVLSPGTNKTNCGRPCDVHQVELRDRTGMNHPLLADVGCRNTLFNAVAQSSAEIVSELQRLGMRRFRVELLRDSEQRVSEILGLYCNLIRGHVTGAQVWRRLAAANQVGVTRGTLEAKRNPLAIL